MERAAAWSLVAASRLYKWAGYVDYPVTAFPKRIVFVIRVYRQLESIARILVQWPRLINDYRRHGKRGLNFPILLIPVTMRIATVSYRDRLRSRNPDARLCKRNDARVIITSKKEKR